MRVKIILEDTNDCKGCPLLFESADRYKGSAHITSGFTCHLGLNLDNFYPFRLTTKRPKRCKEENGL